MTPRLGWCVLPASLLVIATACVAPARSFGAYEGKATTTAQDALSAVETVRLAVVAAAKKDAFGPYLSIVISDAEDTATSVQGTFDSVQPPDPRSDRLRQDLDDRLQDAISVLSDLRIAIRRGETRALSSRMDDLTKAANLLRQFHEAHQ
jgi:hypothetical protein